MRKSVLSLAGLTSLSGFALSALSSAEFGAAFRSAPSRPAPSRRRSTAQRIGRAFFRPRGHTGPAREDRSPAGLARIAAAEAKRARRCSRNIDQALRGGWGAKAQAAAWRRAPMLEAWLEA